MQANDAPQRPFNLTVPSPLFWPAETMLDDLDSPGQMNALYDICRVESDSQPGELEGESKERVVWELDP
jgi:hypothetical protein